jgi:hypothetical protein
MYRIHLDIPRQQILFVDIISPFFYHVLIYLKLCESQSIRSPFPRAPVTRNYRNRTHAFNSRTGISFALEISPRA